MSDVIERAAREACNAEGVECVNRRTQGAGQCTFCLTAAKAAIRVVLEDQMKVVTLPAARMAIDLYAHSIGVKLTIPEPVPDMTNEHENVYPDPEAAP